MEVEMLYKTGNYGKVGEAASEIRPDSWGTSKAVGKL